MPIGPHPRGVGNSPLASQLAQVRVTTQVQSFNCCKHRRFVHKLPSLHLLLGSQPHKNHTHQGCQVPELDILHLRVPAQCHPCQPRSPCPPTFSVHHDDLAQLQHGVVVFLVFSPTELVNNAFFKRDLRRRRGSTPTRAYWNVYGLRKSPRTADGERNPSF